MIKMKTIEQLSVVTTDAEPEVIETEIYEKLIE